MHFIPLFIGIALAIALGTVPIVVPGLPQPLRLGLAVGSAQRFICGLHDQSTLISRVNHCTESERS
jgi:uncharacterized transporter YbjL